MARDVALCSHFAFDYGLFSDAEIELGVHRPGFRPPLNVIPKD